MDRLGCIGWFLLIVVCAAVPMALGASENVSVLVGIVIALIVVAGVVHGSRRGQ